MNLSVMPKRAQEVVQGDNLGKICTTRFLSADL